MEMVVHSPSSSPSWASTHVSSKRISGQGGSGQCWPACGAGSRPVEPRGRPRVTGWERLPGWASGAQLPPPSTWGPRAQLGRAVLPAPALGPGERPRDHGQLLCSPAVPHLPSWGPAQGAKGSVGMGEQVCGLVWGRGSVSYGGGAGGAGRRRPGSDLVSARELLRGPAALQALGPARQPQGFTGLLCAVVRASAGCLA